MSFRELWRGGRLAKRVVLFALLGGLMCGARAQGEDLKAAPEQAVTNMVDDPFLWLEEVSGTRSLEWVRKQNALTTNELVGFQLGGHARPPERVVPGSATTTFDSEGITSSPQA